MIGWWPCGPRTPIGWQTWEQLAEVKEHIITTMPSKTLPGFVSMSKKSSGKKTTKKSKKRNVSKATPSFDIYIHRVAKQWVPNLGVTVGTMKVMNSFVNDIFERLSSEAGKLAHKTKKSTMTEREIQAAVRLLIPGELGTHAIAEGVKCLGTYRFMKDLEAGHGRFGTAASPTNLFG